MNKFFYSLLLCCGFNAVAQEVKEDLLNAAMMRFAGSAYVYGYESKGKELFFKVIRFSEELQRMKDTSIALGTADAGKFHPVSADTLHAYLNFVVQRIDNEKSAQLFRFNKSLKKIAQVDDAEVSRINSFAAFDEEKYFTRRDLYLIRPASRDSSHKLYLQKFHVTDPGKLVEYQFDWQFNFDKNTYKRCHVIAVNDDYVYVYADILAGPKKGQWVLLIDVRNGEVIHAERLNDGMEDFYFLYSNYYYNSKTGDLTVCGAKLPKAGNDLETGKFDLGAGKAKNVNTFICTFDSAGFIKERKDNFIPFPDLTKEKELKNFIFRTEKVLYYNNEYSLLTEIVAEANPKLYRTYGFIFTHLVHDENGALKVSASVPHITYRDPKLPNAKQLTNNYELVKPKDTDWLFYKPALAPAFTGWTWDIQFTGKTVKGISELEIKKANKSSFCQYIFLDKKWESKELFSAAASSGPVLKPINTKKYLVFSTAEPDAVTKLTRSFTIALKEW